MADFDPTALLSRPIDDFKQAPPMPTGGYLSTVAKREFGQSKEKKTPYVEFTLLPTEALPDVDQEKLVEALGESNLMAKEQRITFYLTPDALWRLKEFGRDHVGVSEEEATTTAELIEACVNKQVVFNIEHKPNQKNPERPYANISNTAAVPS